MTTQNKEQMNSKIPSLSQKVDLEISKLQESLAEYRDVTSDKIVSELDIANNMKLIKELTRKKLQEKYSQNNIDTLNSLDFGAASLRLASQRISSSPSPFGTESLLPVAKSQKSILSQDKSVDNKVDTDENDIDLDKSSNLLVEELLKNSKKD